MKNKLLLLIIGLLTNTQLIFSQVPSYVPTNGLAGYWPFNGNANDESGNGNNGTVNGATLTSDRFGYTNRAYNFNGISNFISMSNAPFTNPPFTISAWINCNDFEFNPIIGLGELGTTISKRLYFQPDNNAGIGKPSIGTEGMNDIASIENVTTIGNWHHLVVVVNSYNINSVFFYFNGVLLTGNSTGGSNNPFPLNNAGFTIGKHTGASYSAYTNGKIDDIGIWNRALTQQEITNLYNANQCITNITVTDTLVINIGQLTFENPILYANNITISPNPASSQININFNNITNLVGGTINVINSLGQSVATTPITISGTNTNMELNTWGGTGLYFVHILNPQGQIVDVKKIILQ